MHSMPTGSRTSERFADQPRVAAYGVRPAQQIRVLQSRGCADTLGGHPARLDQDSLESRGPAIKMWSNEHSESLDGSGVLKRRHRRWANEGTETVRNVATGSAIGRSRILADLVPSAVGGCVGADSSIHPGSGGLADNAQLLPVDVRAVAGQRGPDAVGGCTQSLALHDRQRNDRSRRGERSAVLDERRRQGRQQRKRCGQFQRIDDCSQARRAVDDRAVSCHRSPAPQAQHRRIRSIRRPRCDPVAIRRDPQRDRRADP